VVLARLDPIGSSARAVALAAAVEQLDDAEPTSRGAALREILVLLERLAGYTSFFTALAELAGPLPVAAECSTTRERVLDHLEAWTGGRIHHDVVCVGGVTRDVERAWLADTVVVLEAVWAWAQMLERRLLHSRVWQREARGLAAVAAGAAQAGGLSGANLRASGVADDGRAVHADGDVHARAWVRLQDARADCRRVHRLADTLPGGAATPGDAGARFPATVPAGTAATWGEHAGGSFGLLVVSDGTARPWRLHLASPGTTSAAMAHRMACRAPEEVAELVRLSFWPVWGEAAR
jgi:NADH:ubiquinone oxidoreductase subunit D